MVDGFQKIVALNAAKLAAVRCDRAKPDLDILWKQFIRNIGTSA